MWALLTGGLLGPSSTAQTAAPDEKALWSLWQQHLAADDPAAVVAACGEFAEKNGPTDALRPVALEIAAWHLFKAGRHADAVRLLEPLTRHNGTEPAETAAFVARAWLTRVDREAVKTALKTYYHREIEFPPTLAALESSDVPMTDRWGDPWQYRLTGFKHLKGMPAQKYELRSPTLGAASDLHEALDIPYAERITLTPRRLVSGQGATTVVEFVPSTASPDAPEHAGQSAVYIALGAKLGSIFFPYMGPRLILLSDGNHWKPMARPSQ